MTSLMIAGKMFQSHTMRFEATSLSRADTSWRYVDPAGHEHRWHVTATGLPAESYSPEVAYDVPSVEWIEDVPGDDEHPPSGHCECRICRAHVVPGRRADDCVQYIAGPTYFSIDGVSVSQLEFFLQLERAKAIMAWRDPEEA